MLCAQFVVIDAIDDRLVHVGLRWLRKQYFSRALMQMFFSRSSVSECPCAFQHNIHPQLSPRKVIYLRVIQQGDRIAVHPQLIGVSLKRLREAPVR